jgi:serine/threonine protein kinase
MDKQNSEVMKQGDYLDLEPKRVIGSGSFGKYTITRNIHLSIRYLLWTLIGFVFEAYSPSHEMTVAVKRTTKAGDYISREYEILTRLQDCENCVRMLDIFYSQSAEGKKSQNLVFEYCNDNLESVIQRNKREDVYIEIHIVREYMRQILMGLKHCHSQNICHRDLKPENILVKEKTKIKICDFGSGKILTGDGHNTPYIVSRYYRAPELIMGCTDYTTKIDIWGKFLYNNLCSRGMHFRRTFNEKAPVSRKNRR